MSAKATNITMSWIPIIALNSSAHTMADVNVTNGESQDVLVYNGEQWANERDVDGGKF